MILPKNHISIAIAMLIFNFIFRCTPLQAQYNLVPNPSFEVTPTCNLNMLNNDPPPSPWYSPDGGFNYLNACATDPCCTVPFNDYGQNYQYAHTGNAYIGGYFYYNGVTNGRNYAETKLLDSLKNNHSYYVEFYVVHDNSDKYAVNNVGLLITDTATKVNLSSLSGLILANPQILLPGNPIITDTLNWTKVSGVYKAHGGEQYITIGNFKDDANTSSLIVNMNGISGTGYYIDDVSVIDSALLPVLISSYHILQQNHQIINSWQTATEVNVSHFNIQRSSSGNAKDFETVGVVMAKGVGKYEWADDAPLSLERGAGGEALYYRLETVDKDWERMYSDIKKITMNNQMSAFSIYPNPSTNGNIHISFENSHGYNNIAISDMFGRVLKQETVLPGITRLNLNITYPKGVYFVTVTNVKTGIKEMKKIVIQ